ncbi:SPOR domain-containing protein [Halobacillus sp. K22]|uniref:SPOR domain-containing protein n=1 Tax=Halobacillus sp. K22 TaxID=3457431 RepID=UPI003FCE9720
MMESNKKITISFRNENKKVPENEIIQAKEETAASDPHPNKIEEIPVLEIRKPHQSPIKKKKYEKSSVKYLVIAASSALLLSLGLGFLLLRMFVGLTDETTAGKEMIPTTVPAGEEAVSEQESVVNPNTVEAYFVQAGVFTTEEKALQWKSKLTALSVSSMVWERDHQFYLFAGSAQTESEASQIAAELSARNVETYVKPWAVLKGEGSFSGEEAETFEFMIDHLENFSIDQLSDTDRQGLVNTLKEQDQDSLLISPLQEWEKADAYHLNWLKVAYSLEKMME